MPLTLRRRRGAKVPAAPGDRRSRLFSRRGVGAGVALATVVASSAVALSATQASAASVDVQQWYVLVNRNSGKVLDDYGYATNNGAAVVQWGRHSASNQQWRFIDAGGGYYRLQNRTSGKVLDDANWSKAAGSDLVQWSDLNGTNQQFKVAKSSGGYVRLINRFSSMAVEVKGGSKSDGGKIVQNVDRGGANQQWRLVQVGSAGTPTSTATGTTSSTAAGGTSSSATSSSASSSTAGGATTSSATGTKSSTASSSTTGGASTSSATGTKSSTASSSTAGGGNSSVKFMGSSTIFVGGSMSAESYAAAPFDVRYAYIHSKTAPTPAAYTAAKCDPAWSGWWGCWTGPTTSPGTQVTYWQSLAAQATYQGKPRPQKFFWTWYSLRDLGDMAGYGDGPDEVKAINRADLLTQYMNDYRFFLKTVGTSQDLIDIEPDFWGFARSLGNLHQVPAQVKAANPTDCGSQEDSAAGLAQCLVAMTRKYAPNAGVSLHLSCFDWQYNIKKCQSDYLDLGADKADFLGTDITDRDAGWYALPAHGSKNTFWTDQKAAEALNFYKTMSETVGRPVVLWQIPVGNMSGNNTPGHYQDDKVDWLFSHMNQVADAHVAGLLFGAGWTEQTTPETDGGNLFKKTIAYRNAGGVALK